MTRQRWLFLFSAISAVCALAAFCKIDVITIANVFGVSGIAGISFSLRDIIIILFIVFALVLSGVGFYLSKRKKQETDVPSSITEKFLVPVDIYPLHDPNAQGFPHKLCIAVKNESGKDLVVNPARWEKRAVSDIAFRRSDYQPWIPEGPNGWEKRDWIWRRSPDRGAIHLPRDGTIITWVGLHEAIDAVELNQRIVGKRLGTLVVPLTADGAATSETIKL